MMSGNTTKPMTMPTMLPSTLALRAATELTYELQFGIYLIVALGGCSKEKASVIDVLCDNILSSLARIKNVRTEKS